MQENSQQYSLQLLEEYCEALGYCQGFYLKILKAHDLRNDFGSDFLSATSVERLTRLKGVSILALQHHQLLLQDYTDRNLF